MPGPIIGAMTHIPVIETQRLRLRPHRAADFPDMQALWGDARTVRFIGGHVQDAQTVWFRLLRYAGMWALLGYGFWAIEDRATGAYLGDGGLMDGRRGIALLDGAPEIGWALMPEAGGRGLATELAVAVTGWADIALKARATRCIIEPDNAASLRVAGKAGYTEIGRAALGEKAVIVLERRAA
ncbi:MAG TPA: GNAT family N-acetyltransferase [Sphingobium sp.]